MKILIIEDEAPAFRRLQKILEEVEPDILLKLPVSRISKPDTVWYTW